MTTRSSSTSSTSSSARKKRTTRNFGERAFLLLLLLSASAIEGATSLTPTSDTSNIEQDKSDTSSSLHAQNLRRRTEETASSSISSSSETKTKQTKTTTSPDPSSTKRNLQDPQQQQQQQPGRRPNVLMIIADQMRYDMIRFVQDTLPHYNKLQQQQPVLKISTPNLDRLLQSGAYFETAYTQCAVCAPARATLRTGCTIERHGVQHNELTKDENLYYEDQEQSLMMATDSVEQDDLDEQVYEQTDNNNNNLVSPSQFAHQFSVRVNNVKTIDHILVQKLGYVSEYYGKLHLPKAMSFEKLPQYLDPLQPPEVSRQQSQQQQQQRTYDPSRPIFQNNDYDYATDAFRFQFDSDGRKNTRFLNYHERVLNEISSTTFPMEGMQKDIFTKFPYLPIQLDTRYGQPTNTELHTMNVHDPAMLSQDNVMGMFVESVGSLASNYTPSFFTADVVQKALKRLQRPDQTKPWFVTASFHAPHPPFVASWEYLEKYWNERHRLLVPDSLQGQTTPDIPNSYRRIQWTDAFQDSSKVSEWTAIYYGLVEEVDTKIGELLNSVEDLDNTIVIFTSDHGEMLGSHGRRSKNNHYEESARVPLLISWPNYIDANQTITDPVSHIDIVATILDLVDAPPGIDESDGKSLSRYMKMKDQPPASTRITNPLTRVSNELRLSSEMLPNASYDESFVVSEWDFRKPVKSNPHTELERPIDDRPNFLIRKGHMKLLMSKLARSNRPDILFNLEQDPFEMDNLLSKSSLPSFTPSPESLVSTEHLRCLLLDWMTRMDSHPSSGGARYYSDPASNYNQNRGDIVEIFERQSWPRIGFWSSHSQSNPLPFGQISKLPNEHGGGWMRHEWLYVGTRLDERIIIDGVNIVGSDASYFTTQRPDLQIFGGPLPVEESGRQRGCEGIRITFKADIWVVRPTQVDASVVLTVRDRPQVVIPIVLTDPSFVVTASP